MDAQLGSPGALDNENLAELKSSPGFRQVNLESQQKSPLFFHPQQVHHCEGGGNEPLALFGHGSAAVASFRGSLKRRLAHDYSPDSLDPPIGR